ncbi:hypothetical protein KPL49_24555 [Clostridium estertheticum]|nr:hypothetical protein [Clostridium estertheticum]
MVSTKIKEQIQILMEKINDADAIVVGAGSGLSSAAGYNYYHSKEIKVPSDLIPRCSKCGRIMMPWVRDYEFLEGSFWKDYVNRYQNSLKEYLEKEKDKNVLFLELGVGDMTPSIIKLPFWKMTASYPNTFYISINHEKSSTPEHLQGRAIAISEDIGHVLRQCPHLADFVQKKGDVNDERNNT